MPFKQVNETNYYYEIHGKGYPVVLIAGYTGDHTTWIPILEMLSKHYQVLIFDNRACGQTKDQNQPLAPIDLAKDTIDLAESLGLYKPHIIGQSMGGIIAQAIAAEYGSRIGKLILLVSTTKLRHAALMGLGSLIAMREKNVDFEEIFYGILAWVFGESFLSDKKMVQQLFEIFKNNPYSQSLEDQKRQFALLKQCDSTHLLKKISNPALVIYGNEDLLVLPSEAKHLADSLKAQIKMLSGAHGLIAECSSELTHAIHQFLG